jgi:hypothetical protein
MAKKQKEPEETIETGMEVEATKGDLGEDDVSKPKVTEVVQDQQGKVDKVVVQKGVIFRKTIEIPADRIASINREGSGDKNAPGKVIVDVSKKEAEALEPEKEYGLLDKVEQEVPTAEGLRELEASNRVTQAKQSPHQSIDDDTSIPQDMKPQHASSGDEESHPTPNKKTISFCAYSVQGS